MRSDFALVTRKQKNFQQRSAHVLVFDLSLFYRRRKGKNQEREAQGNGEND